MPYRLINKLRELEQLGFKPLPTAEGSTTLNEANLPDQAFTCIDQIDHIAKVLFGRTLKPSVHQQSIMEREGYPVRPGKQRGPLWVTGEIVTAKGVIVYS